MPRLISALLLFLTLPLMAVRHPDQRVVEFSHTADVGFGNSLYVVGDAAELGANDPAKGIKLRYTAGNVWTGKIAIEPSVAPINYRFVSRSTDPAVICSSEHVSDVATGLSLLVSTQTPAPYAGKSVEYLSTWSQAFILYKSASEASFTQLEMTRIGEGRVTGESRFRIEGIGVAGESMQFVFTNGAGDWDNAFATSGLNYQTALDFIYLQDGHVYNYVPAATVSGRRIETRSVGSTAPGIAARTIRIYLPRGYDSHPTRRYPVLYMHDGQNVFSPGGAFGSWNADLTADAEIQMGRMRECIIVAIDNTEDRLAEYLPPTDFFNQEGEGDHYANFVINNVRPTLDVNYRTLNDVPNTLVMGSSFGGIISVYMAWAHSDVFGKAGLLSPSWWAIPNLRDELRDAAARTERIYLYWGTEESSGSADAATWWPPFIDGYDIYLSQNYGVGRDLRARIGCGEAHNEAAWASYLPEAFRYLLDIRDEANQLAYRTQAPELSISFNASGDVVLDYYALAGYQLSLQQATDLTAEVPWSLVAEDRSDFLWEPRQLRFTPPTDAAFFLMQHQP